MVHQSISIRATVWIGVATLAITACTNWTSAVPVSLYTPTSGPATRPSPIGSALETAKREHTNEVASAQAAYVAVIDARLNAAEDAGNLAETELLLAAKRRELADGSLPEDQKDPAIVGAYAKMRKRIDAADAQLAAAYREAVVRFTKARQIERAEAAQKEFIESGLAMKIPEASGTTGQTVDLSVSFPPYLVDKEPYSKVPGGIRTNPFIWTRAADFLDKDFTLEVWFTPERADNAEPVLIGIGSGNPEGPDPICISLEMKSPSDRGSNVTINTGQWEGSQIGVVHEEGTCVARMVKHGNEIGFSLGVESGGRFTPDVSGAIADIRTVQKQLNNRNTHLYFGHRHTRGNEDGNVTFNKVRLVMGAPSAPAAPIGAFQSSKPSELNAGLPAYLSADQPYATNRDGIQIERPIKTVQADFLDRDFTFEVAFTCQKENDAEAVLIGVGGTGDPDSDDGTCLSLVVDQTNENRGTEVFVNTQRWNNHKAGVVHGYGPFVARIQKKANRLMFEVGTEADGSFKPDVSATVADIRQLKPNFNERNTHLFFGHRHARGKGDGGVTFERVSLVVTPAGQEK